MANSYFPMLPKVNEEVSKVLKDQAGIWKETDINFLQGLANSLDCGDSIKDMGSVDSIPDIWARPLLFKMALFDLEPTKQFITGLHEKVKGEWRALLSMLALKDFKQLDLRAEQVNLLENRSDLAEILKSLAPTDSLTGNRDSWLTDIYIIYFNGLPIAMTSPTTLIAPTADYENVFEGKIFTPFSSNQKTLTDPIKFLSPAEISALKMWLQNLYAKIQSLNVKSNEISNSILKCIADYQRDVAAAQISDANFDLVPSNLNLHVGIARLLDDTVKGREPRFEDSAVRLLNDKRNILLVSPAFVRDFAKFEGVNPSKLVIWQGISANEISDDKLRDHKKIGRTVLKNTEFRRPDDFFYERMAVTEPANAFPNSPKLQGADSLSDKDLTPILPVKRELLEIFSPEEISDRISISDDKDNFYIHFIFPLSGIDGNGTNFRFTKAYPKQNLIYIDQEVPVIELYPDFRAKNWNTYFLYYENYRAQSDDDALASDIYFVAPYNLKIKENTLQNRFTAKLDSFPEILTVTYNPPPHFNKKPYEIGVILLNKPKKVECNPNLSWKIGVDFGTSSAMVFFAENDNPPRPLNFSPHLFQITASGGARTQTYRYFIPSQMPARADGSFLSIFHLLKASEIIRPLQDGHVFLLSSENTRVFEQFAPFIDANLKWQDDDRQRRKTAAYIKQICLQAAAEAVFNGVNDIQWNFSYPTAFSQAQKVSFQEICRESVNESPNFYSESKAAAYHFNKLDGKTGNFAQGAICIDIGAGTTDISVISGDSPRIVYHTSIKYAARQLFKPIYDNFELFADEKIISGKLNDETQRQAVIDADLREHSEKYLADLKFKTGKEQIKTVLQAAQFATAALFHYLGELVKVLHDYGHYKEKNIPHVFVGGNGARIFRWLTGGTDLEGNIYLNVLENIFVQAAQLQNYKKFYLHLSPQPKIEVAAGMIVEKPANDSDFFDEDKINREMFGEADEIIYSAVLAGADFVQSGENQSANSFISAHDISEGINVNSLHEFKIFVERFNSAQKLWAEGIIFDEEELIRDVNNFFVD